MPPKDKTSSSRTRKSRRKKGGRARSSAASTRKAPAPAVNQNSAPAAVLNEQKLQQLYSSMLKCQMLARRVQEISTTAQKNVVGREAVLAGAVAHLQREDSVAVAHSAFLANFLRGEPLNALVAQQLSNTASSAPHNEKVSPAQLALIHGMDQAQELLGSGSVALVFCGHDPAALGFQQEALALAAKHKAPIVCLIETNLSSLAAEEQRRSKKKRAQPRFPEIVVDGADVVAIFRVAQEAIRRARTGQGPTLLKCVMPETLCAEPHDNAAAVTGHDPLAFMERYLRQRNLWSDEWRRNIADEFQRELEKIAIIAKIG